MKVESDRPTYPTALGALIFTAIAVSGAWALEKPMDSSQAVPPNFTGHWVLNAKESDDIAEIMLEAMGARQDSGGGLEQGRGGGKGGGGGRGGGSGAGRGGGSDKGGSTGGNEERQVRAQQKLARAQEEYSRLEIFHEGVELNVTNGLDISRLLFTDGRQMNIWTQNGEAAATASWQDRTLVVTWKTSQDNMSRIRYYTLAEGGQQLTLTENRRLPGQDKALDIKMVYDLQDP